MYEPRLLAHFCFAAAVEHSHPHIVPRTHSSHETWQEESEIRDTAEAGHSEHHSFSKMERS